MNERDAVVRYHDATKHHFHRFARSIGYLDWASQPNPFRSFAGSPQYALHNPQSTLPPSTDSGHAQRVEARRNPQWAVADILRHSLGLSAWKQFGQSRWSLRVNPSSGNLHPTEAYLVLGSLPDADEHEAVRPEEREPFVRAAIHHYAADRHVLEQRCTFDAAAWRAATGGDASAWLIALTSIHWREAWKYGERAFRYCQHDLGHAIAAVRIAAAQHGLCASVLPDWSHADIAALTGIDRDEDFFEAEREEAACLLLITGPQSAFRKPQWPIVARETLVAAVRRGNWTGRASQLSEAHVKWTIIDEIAEATRDSGRTNLPAYNQLPSHPIPPLPDRALLLQRRSAVALDARSSMSGAAFFRTLARVMPSAAPPWDAMWWDARIHLVLFVHRVDNVAPGLYLLARNGSAIDRLRASCGRAFLWEPASDTLPLFLLARGDCRSLSQRVSCDQEIAADGFFSLGMLADFDASLQQFGAPFYRHLFWESGIVGQALYLEAEAAGARGTGIGCFYDDPVHDVLGLSGHAFQSLYHFTVGVPVEDTRLTTEPGYEWER